MFWPEVRFTKKERSSHPESPHGLSTHLCWAGSQQSRQSSLGGAGDLGDLGGPRKVAVGQAPRKDKLVP